MKSVPVKLFSSSSTLGEPGADLAQIRRQKYTQVIGGYLLEVASAQNSAPRHQAKSPEKSLKRKEAHG